MITLLRGSHANQFELQNYDPLMGKLDIQVVTTSHPLTPLNLPTITLGSPATLPNFPLRRQILNRLIGGEQWLLGLEKIVSHGDIIHTAETYTPYTHQAVMLRKSHAISRLICTCWETIPHNNEKFARLRSWKKQTYQYVDLFHTPTILAKQALLKEGVPDEKIKVIPYGVNLSLFHPRTQKIKHRLKVISVGRPVAEKGYDLFSQLSHDLSDYAEFEWISQLPYDQMPLKYRQADIFVLFTQPTKYWEEQYGMVLVEAMASALPIVTTNAGATTEVVNNSAILINPHDYQAAKSALMSLINDKTQRVELGSLALSRAMQLDPNKVAKKLASLYTMPN